MDELPAHAGSRREEYDTNVGYIHGRRARLLGIPSIRLCSFLSEVVRAVGEDGFPGTAPLTPTQTTTSPIVS